MKSTGVHTFANRAKNFHYKSLQETVEECPHIWQDLYELKESIKRKFNDYATKDKRFLLKGIFNEVYDYVIANPNKWLEYDTDPKCSQNDSETRGDDCPDFDFEIFGKNHQYFNDVMDACIYFTLDIFIDYAKRIERLTLENFCSKHSIHKYDIEAEVKRFNQFKRRNLPNFGYESKIYEPSMPKSIEHELLIHINLASKLEPKDPDSNLIKICNTFFDFLHEINSLRLKAEDGEDAENGEILEGELYDGITRLIHLLHNITYSDYISFYKYLDEKIREDKLYYGMTLSKYESKFKFCKIIREVGNLLKDEANEFSVFSRFIILHNIVFLGLYRSFGEHIDDIRYTSCLASIIEPFLGFVAIPSLLIIDEFVEDGHFGDNWEIFFLDTVNEIIDRGHEGGYEKIDYPINEKAEEKFRILMTLTISDILQDNRLLQESRIKADTTINSQIAPSSDSMAEHFKSDYAEFVMCEEMFKFTSKISACFANEKGLENALFYMQRLLYQKKLKAAIRLQKRWRPRH